MNYLTQSKFSPKDPRAAEKKIEVPSITVPGQSMTIEQMFQKWSVGHPVMGVKNEPRYVDTENFNSPDLEKLKNADLIDKEEFSKKLGDEMLQTEKQQKKAAEEAKAKKDKEDDDALTAKAEKLLAKKSATEKKDDTGVTPH